MCANYLPSPPSAFRLHYDAAEPTFEYTEAYPGSSAPILIRSAEYPDERKVERAVFGMIPVWAKDQKIARKTYNARSETVGVRNSYRRPWNRRQFCLVPAQAFYEPNYESGKAIRWRIHREDDQPFALAGIWDAWKTDTGEWIRSFSMLTVNADDSPLMRRFHGIDDEKRSVVAVPADRYDDWLDAEDDVAARAMLRSIGGTAFTAVAASSVG